MAHDEEEALSPLAALVDALRHRRRAFVAAGVLAVLALIGWRLSDSLGARVAADPRYQITAETIETTPPPTWVRSDFRAQALEQAGLGPDTGAPLSALAPPAELEARLSSAFTRHPWVKSIGRIAKRPPNRLSIELNYRVPLAAVGITSAPGRLLLVDAEAVRLPEADLSESELRHLPRITLAADTAQVDRPQLGTPWSSRHIRGAVSIVAGLGPAWWDLGFADIAPNPRLEVRGGSRFTTYELISKGGTRVAWGASPLETPPGEPPFQTKLAHLMNYVRTNGPLAGNTSPSRIDVRTSQIYVEPRTAKETKPDGELLK